MINCLVVFHTTLHVFLSHFYLYRLNILIIWETDVTTLYSLKRTHKSITDILSSDNCINISYWLYMYVLLLSHILSTFIQWILYCTWYITDMNYRYCWCWSDESELMAAKMKVLDTCKSSSTSSSTVAGGAGGRPTKDVNTFVNNQLKFTSGPNSIPPDQMKCNILKAAASTEQHSKQCTMHTALCRLAVCYDFPLWMCTVTGCYLCRCLSLSAVRCGRLCCVVLIHPNDF